MPDFYKLLMRHGEHGMQDLIERIERNEGIKSDPEHLLPLEERWAALMRQPQTQAA